MIQFVCDFDALLYSSLASGITEIRKSLAKWIILLILVQRLFTI